MNEIILKGKLKGIEYSHTLNDIEYDKAYVSVRKDNLPDDDVIPIRFKKFSNYYKDGDEVELQGNIRSYSTIDDTGKHKVEVYVFTYFEIPSEELNKNNYFEIDGNICKIDSIHKTQSGKDNIHFIIANNIFSSDGKRKVNSYIPMVAWGKVARELAKLKVGDRIKTSGQFHSRTYKKKLNDDEIEFRTAYEGLVLHFEKVEN